MEIQVKGRVLFVEGAPQSSRSGSNSLARAGFEMFSASKEAEALSLLVKESFDVLVVDLDLSQIDGLSLIRRLRETGSAAAVVWLVSRNTNELATEAAEAGVLQVLQKPADPKVLERLVAAGVAQTRHLLATLRAIMRPSAQHRSVSATEAKNEFGSILEAAVQNGAVVITKHDSPRAVLVSVDRMAGLLAKHEPDLQALTREFDEMVAHMNAPKARAAARDLFAATPKQLGEAALAGVKKRRG